MAGPDVADELLAAGRAACPEVALARDTLATALARVTPAPDDLVGNGVDFILAVAAAAGEQAALRRVDEILVAAATPALRRYDRGAAFIAEVLQRVRIQLLVPEHDAPPRLARYDARSSLRAWLGVCAVRMALHVMRGERHAPEVATDWVDVVAALPSGRDELEEVRTRYAATFNAAWREACDALPARQRTLLRMCFVDSTPIDDIARAYAVHRVTVWRWLEDAKRRLLEGTRARLGARLASNDPGTASLLELVQSQLDLGLSQLDPAAAASD